MEREPEFRRLDGIYLRVKRDGKYQAICLSDMTAKELENVLDERRGAWLKGAVIHLALLLRNIGDKFDLISVEDCEDEGKGD